MSTYPSDRVLALAGVWQAATLVDLTATTGNADSDAVQASIGSVLRIDAPDAAAVFGGAAGVALGLRSLVEHANQRDPHSMRLTRYVVSLLHLERRMSKRSELGEAVHKGVVAAQRQAEHFDTAHNVVLAALAHIYEQTFSTLNYRIQVSGEQTHLAIPDNVNRVRALLLSGIRAAVLYRQLGGGSWALLLLQRKRISAEAEALLGTL